MKEASRYYILLADDDADDQELFVEALADTPTEISAVYNGIQLMQKLTSDSRLPDIIFLDLNMPEKDGKECLSELKRTPELASIMIFIYSTSRSKRDIDETFDLGATLYITKPNSFTELKHTLKSVISMAAELAQPKTISDFVFTMKHKQPG
jgi:CheY-like chemotaxis protein